MDYLPGSGPARHSSDTSTRISPLRSMKFCGCTHCSRNNLNSRSFSALAWPSWDLTLTAASRGTFKGVSLQPSPQWRSISLFTTPSAEPRSFARLQPSRRPWWNRFARAGSSTSICCHGCCERHIRLQAKRSSKCRFANGTILMVLTFHSADGLVLWPSSVGSGEPPNTRKLTRGPIACDLPGATSQSAPHPRRRGPRHLLGLQRYRTGRTTRLLSDARLLSTDAAVIDRDHSRCEGKPSDADHGASF